MKAENSVFLETTAIIDYSFKADKHKIRELLSRYSCKIASQYVKMEIKRGVIQYIILLHNKLVTYPTFQSVIDSVQRISRTPQRNRLSTMLEAISTFFKKIALTTPDEIKKKYGNISMDEYLKNESASYLRVVIRKIWNNIDLLADEILNPMDCFPDIKVPYSDGKVFKNDPRQCNKSVAECKIKRFVEENKKDFKKILTTLNEISEKDAETEKRIKSLKEILRLIPYATRDFSNKQQNFKSCWDCGDAILTVLAPKDSVILTSNIKHYEPMCKAIGKNLICWL